MEPDTDAPETRSLDAEDTPAFGVGCVIVLLALLGGFGLAVLQNIDTVDGWSYCFGAAPGAVVDSGDSLWLGTLFLLRVPGYAVCLACGMAAGMRLTRGRPAIVRLSAALGVSLLFGVLAFWADYAVDNGLGSMYVSPRCPHARPPWWPSWAPLHIA